MEDIYLLELQENKYYVGRTTNFNNRIEQHLTGNGAAFTKKYGPQKRCRTLGQYLSGVAGEETKQTLSLMMTHGINNVRGAEYCQLANFKLEDCERMSYAALHHCGPGINQKDVEKMFISQINKENTKITKQSYHSDEEDYDDDEEEEVTKLTSNVKKLKIDDLYETLRQYRLKLSTKKKVQSHFVFNNETLDALVKYKPTTLKELEQIKGIGPKKLEELGNDIINIINSSLSQKCVSCLKDIETNHSKPHCYNCWKNKK